VFPMLRQQRDPGGDGPTKSLADFIAPAESGLTDHLGAFAVTAGLGADDLVKRFEAEHDDYRAIIVKALADRLAEAYAEWLHLQVRRAWYAPDEHLRSEDLIRERFRGIRPAFGYPACPDHSEKTKLFALLGAEQVGLALTESFAMTPAAAVSGIYLAHPQARYFAVGRIGDDQLADYATRKRESLEQAARWLSPALA
jgi:5-methyltetrahydrofolate--homocysteine methyltransferase